MTSTFFGLQLGYSGLMANQTALDVVSNNTTNVNTPGYTRQVVNFTEGSPYTVPGTGSPTLGQLGTGVNISSVSQVKDQYLNQQVWAAGSNLSSSNSLSSSLSQVESAFGEPSSTGIGAQMTNFFNSFSSLSTNPQDSGLRTTVVDTAVSLTTEFHTVSSNLAALTPQITNQTNSAISQVNTLASQIADLNAQVKLAVTNGNSPNDLMDKRGQLITQLSSLVNVQPINATDPVTGKSTGAINLNVGGFSLVQDGVATPLPSTVTSLDGQSGLMTSTGTFIPIQSGQLSGLLQAGTLVSGYQSQLDTLAYNFATSVNSIHQTGAALDGTTGHLFFTVPPPSPGTGAAAAINVDPGIISNPNNIAAATMPVPPATPAPGNGDNATAISQLASTTVINGQSLSDYYNGLIAKIGADSQVSQQQVTTQTAVVTQLQNQQSSVSGVNMDEELTKMLQYQRSYQAAAKLVSVADSFLDTIINTMQ